VDEHQLTASRASTAIGDVVAGTPQLAHVATMEGMVAVAHMAGKPAKPINRNRIPGCTYTEPGIGSVGLTEAQARAQGYAVKVGKFHSSPMQGDILGQSRWLREGGGGEKIWRDPGRPHYRAGGV